MSVFVLNISIYLSIYLYISADAARTQKTPWRDNKGDRQQVVERQQVVVYECNKSLDNRNKKRHESQQER